ncbi:MAG: radical SAM family heme chaperone HemW [Paracoccaceae bacterium]|nr:radical SAM family heme chaperone HemW [Paracoccaceae bacterium]
MPLRNSWPAALGEDWRYGGFGLYVHWPFCEAKCPYCDFNSHVAAHVDQERWAKALAAEINRVGALTEGRVLNSVFFGGGTPSLMEPATVDTVLKAAQAAWPWANDIEISLEANPRSVEADRFRGFADAGVNRVSLGVQSLRDADLKRLGRLHDAREARAAFDTARAVFDRVSFDLIYARQDQSLTDWEAELTEAMQMAVDHLSLYQLTIEPGTAFWDRAQRGRLRGLPGEDLASDMYQVTQDVTAAHGFSAYEVSNHAKPRAESRHNLVYWRYGDYAGVGPGAHGRLSLEGRKYATVGWQAPGKWLAATEAGSGDENVEKVPPHEQGIEQILMGLRLLEGISVQRLQEVNAGAIDAGGLQELLDLGFVGMDGDRLIATETGRPVLNAVIEKLIAS